MNFMETHLHDSSSVEFLSKMKTRKRSSPGSSFEFEWLVFILIGSESKSERGEKDGGHVIPLIKHL